MRNMKNMTDLRSDVALALSRGFDAGNYANAYTAQDLETAWDTVSEEATESRADMMDEQPAFRAGFILGFFSSYELDEISGEDREEFDDCYYTWADAARSIGIAVDDRADEYRALGE